MLHHLRQIRARRPATLSGIDFINSVLVEAGRDQITQVNYDEWRSALLDDKFMAQAFDSARSVLCRLTPSKIERWSKSFHTFMEDHGSAAIDTFYILVRAMAPGRVVETGVHTGYTTSLISAALAHNNNGHLTSIDLPSSGGMEDIKISEDETGLLVPTEFRSRWTLVRGNSLLELPKILLDQKPEIFSHDSDHSYSHMAFEYGLAASVLPTGSIIMSDDTTLNSAFSDISAGIGSKHFRHAQNLNFSVISLR